MIGVDIVKVDRFKRIKIKDFNFWKKHFTREEWKYSFSQANFYERLGGIFAAKEAVIKSNKAEKIKNHSQLEIKHFKNGAPYVKVAITPRKKIHISISHDGGMAIAVAIIR